MEKKKKRKRLEYLKKLQDKILTEDATLMVDTENSQVVWAKCKEITNISSEDKVYQSCK